MSVMKRVYLFKGFLRFWHWSQAALIIFMALTGFEIHGSYTLFGFEDAVSLHRASAWILIALWTYANFWHLITGEWKQYIPTGEKFTAMILYYSLGIFRQSPHPFRPVPLNKHNPLQRVAYLFFKGAITPLIWASGLLYLSYDIWGILGLDGLSLGWVALVHTLAAYLLLTFLAAHLYLITTGHTVISQLKAMITGWDEVEE
ncbi:MAG: cytochrome b/b6 domain-containing protein [Rhodospirillales bacterium]|jgi:thiosulfate reductase cytochrome b subunit|nr:cytochrome b/b6 domain-containing protein [Rhodospirillales bacterium]